MLKVTEYKESQPINIEYDLYTPINIEFGAWDISKEQTIYWRTGDFKKSLIEIGIGKYTGNIRSITLTLSENVHQIEDLNLDMKNITLINGIPNFQVEEYDDKTSIDENSKLNVYIGIDHVLISFSENDTVSIVQNDNVGFALDKDRMVCGILVSGMLEHEKNILEEALK
ncbi:hypothetical protein P9B03_13500 [Metasolibacillus meyeri]|uniref:Uncharacterized protein n=1 Tax=Metasolibacillus meyeri TaxID=1071052 RepID=A0AAW9NWT6_9BACL|nr:hypothetical protein [Metasolibacillus meyeri]MEC1179508.1 hypothetical protein [Metasolibacillus meyeri]